LALKKDLKCKTIKAVERRCVGKRQKVPYLDMFIKIAPVLKWGILFKCPYLQTAANPNPLRFSSSKLLADTMAMIPMTILTVEMKFHVHSKT